MRKLFGSLSDLFILMECIIYFFTVQPIVHAGISSRGCPVEQG